jgi:hypothetical protein
MGAGECRKKGLGVIVGWGEYVLRLTSTESIKLHAIYNI